MPNMINLASTGLNQSSILEDKQQTTKRAFVLLAIFSLEVIG